MNLRSTQFKWIYSIKVFLLLTITSYGFAQKLPVVTNFSQIEFKLQTFAPGLPVAEKYGHIQIRVKSSKPFFDRVVSWGMYDFRDPNFLKNFLKGHTYYRIASFSTKRSVRHYERLNRTYWEHDIHLDLDQKKSLYTEIQRQLSKPNNVYLYNFFFDNCSTRIRDLFDMLSDGKLKTYAKNIDLGQSYRDTVRFHQSTTWMTGLGLSVWASHVMDAPLTGWEEMYLPNTVMKYAVNIPNGDRPLLTNERSFGNGDIPSGWPWWDEIGLLFLFVLPFLIFLMLNLKKPLRCLKTAKFWLSIWWLLTGFISTIMLAGWVYSDLVITHHSANLWILWPLDFFLVFLIWWIPKRKRLTRILRFYAYLHLSLIHI